MDAGFQSGQTVLQRYQLLSLLGEGGFGAVFKARQTTTGQLVAVKVLLVQNEHASIPAHERQERFWREMKLIGELRDPHTVRLIDFGVEGRSPVMVLEFVDGETLSERLRMLGPMSLTLSTRVIRQVLEALAEAHDLGIVHRDLKPENIMLVGKGRRLNAKILDFGISGFIDEDSSKDRPGITLSGQMRGTPAYMAPEQLQFFASPMRESDLYAVGLVWLECLTGVQAVQAENAAAVCYKQLNDPIELPDYLLDHPVGEILLKACKKDPAQRFQSADAMLDALDALDASQTVLPVSSTSVPRADTTLVSGIFSLVQLAAEADADPDHSETDGEPQETSGSFPIDVEADDEADDDTSGSFPINFGGGDSADPSWDDVALDWPEERDEDEDENEGGDSTFVSGMFDIHSLAGHAQAPAAVEETEVPAPSRGQSSAPDLGRLKPISLSLSSAQDPSDARPGFSTLTGIHPDLPGMAAIRPLVGSALEKDAVGEDRRDEDVGGEPPPDHSSTSRLLTHEEKLALYEYSGISQPPVPFSMVSSAEVFALSQGDDLAPDPEPSLLEDDARSFLEDDARSFLEDDARSFLEDDARSFLEDDASSSPEDDASSSPEDDASSSLEVSQTLDALKVPPEVLSVALKTLNFNREEMLQAHPDMQAQVNASTPEAEGPDAELLDDVVLDPLEALLQERENAEPFASNPWSSAPRAEALDSSPPSQRAGTIVIVVLLVVIVVLAGILIL